MLRLYGQFLGVILVCSFMWHWKKEVVIAAIIFVIFFGGLDYLGFLRTERYPILGIQHLEWHAGPGKYQYSSMTTHVYSDSTALCARSFRTTLTEDESHPHGNCTAA